MLGRLTAEIAMRDPLAFQIAKKYGLSPARLSRVLGILRKYGVVAGIGRLSRIVGTAESTLRRYLHALEAEGLLEKTYLNGVAVIRCKGSLAPSLDRGSAGGQSRSNDQDDEVYVAPTAGVDTW